MVLTERMVGMTKQEAILEVRKLFAKCGFDASDLTDEQIEEVCILIADEIQSYLESVIRGFTNLAASILQAWKDKDVVI